MNIIRDRQNGLHKKVQLRKATIFKNAKPETNLAYKLTIRAHMLHHMLNCIIYIIYINNLGSGLDFS